jgi:hypothetical protein
MGKAARLKGIKKVAATLPTIMRNTHEVHYVKGSELIEQGHTECGGKAINPEGMYVQNMPVMIAINHARNLKKVFQKYGERGARIYMQVMNEKKSLSHG